MDRKLIAIYMKLAMTPGLGAVKIKRLYEKLGSFKKLAAFSKGELIEYIPPMLVRELEQGITSSNPKIEKELDRVEKMGVTIIPLEDKEYPALLKEIDAPPPYIYVLGDTSLLNKPSIAVVGTRTPTEQGIKATRQIVSTLVESGFVIISGFASGIDSEAHRAALSAGGKTVAVFGCGINKVYPARNTSLYKKIQNQGALISEFPLDSPPTKYNFPRRNRIISGLCEATVIIEAGKRSGALITANFALEQNRELFALPGPIDAEKSKGTNKLIELGATPITSPDVILKTLEKPVLEVITQEPTGTDTMEDKILVLLKNEPLHIDTIAERLNEPVQAISSLLFVMELNGLVKSLPGMRFTGK